ncbi:uncharacterized protein FIBRA_02219 [Fibroporia radiculosa]|uniref:Ubiquitin 3 binding protein But2 C-terminal domain-containing protein n=1 Tax=Fibroporia radiculosa TaxID=599839 RepID=J4I8X9_9APHY|nr:uncharacterized protein FIBRA_02219 [Fibroporia radiculosa]CCM00191.1 predicted protein [Fibroporia radiculosa]
MLMFSAKFTVVVAFLAATSFAAPALQGRHSMDPCAGLGNYTYSTASGFSLAALYTDATNANRTGVPLVLGDTADSSTSNAILATLASAPAYTWPGPEMSLVDGALYPVSSDPDVSASGSAVTAGGELRFTITQPLSDPIDGAEIYCVQSFGSPAGFQLPVLAVNGDTGSFSLCATNEDDTSQVNVVYQAAPRDSNYKYDTCLPVRLQVVY